MYKYELHLHTMETSRCGHVRAADQVRTYHRLGYQGLCVTDHLHNTYIDLMDCHDDWHECVRRYLYGYHLAKEEGERLGMDIIFGVELRFPENDSDYLIYGIDEKWLYDHPYVCRMDHQAFFDRFKDEVLIIHAHPYRNCDEVSPPYPHRGLRRPPAGGRGPRGPAERGAHPRFLRHERGHHLRAVPALVPGI